MKVISIASSILSLFLLSAFTITQQLQWEIADDYVVSFDGRGASGSFSALDGKINFNPSDLAASSMDVSVNASTISTDSNGKDRHAKGDSWLDTEAFPTINFVSEKFVRRKDTYSVIGKLTLHGVSKEVEIPFTFTPNKTGGLFEGNFTVSRKDYGIKGPLMGFAVGNDFDISLKVPVKR